VALFEGVSALVCRYTMPSHWIRTFLRNTYATGKSSKEKRMVMTVIFSPRDNLKRVENLKLSCVYLTMTWCIQGFVHF
jgi:hypothetical protein